MNKGLKAYTKQLTFGIGTVRANVNINLNDANLHFTVPLLETFGRVPFSLSLVYNYQDRAELSCFGYGVKHSLYSNISYSTAEVTVKNPDGSTDKYMQSEGYYNKETGLTFSKTGSDLLTKYHFTDNLGNKKTYLITLSCPYTVTTQYGETLTVMDFSDGSGYIENAYGDKITFVKADGQNLCSYAEYTYEGLKIASVHFTYTNQKLASVEYKKYNEAGTESDTYAKVSFAYDTTGITVTNDITTEKLKFTISNDRVSQIKHGFGDNFIGEKNTDIAYIGYLSRAQNHLGKQWYCLFDSDGYPICEFDEDFNASEILFSKEYGKLLAQSATVPASPDENLLSANDLSVFTKDSGITRLSVFPVNTFYHSFLSSSLYKVSGTGKLTYTVNRTVIGGDAITASMWARKVGDGAVTVKLSAENDGLDCLEDYGVFENCGNHYTLMTLGLNPTKTYSKIKMEFTLSAGAEIEIGRIYVFNKEFGAFYEYNDDGTLAQAGVGNATTEISYSAKLPTQRVGADSGYVKIERDAYKRITKATTAYGVTVTNTYDTTAKELLGSSICKNSNGDTLAKANMYSSNKRYLSGVRDGLNNTTQYQYAQSGDVKKITDAAKSISDIVYNTNGSIDTLTLNKDTNSAAVQYEYDAGDKFLKTVTNPSGVNYEFHYDEQKRIDYVKLQNNEIYSFAYDTVTGNISAKGFSKGDFFKFYYTYDGLLQTVKYKASETSSEVLKFTYIYDVYDRVLNVKNESGVNIIEYVYDVDGRVVTVKRPQGNIYYGYDNLGNVNRQTAEVGGKKLYQAFDSVARSKGAHPMTLVAKYKDSNLVGTFEGGLSLLCGEEEFANQAISGYTAPTVHRDGVVYYATFDESNSLKYLVDGEDGGPSFEYNGCVQFLFRPASLTGQRALFTTRNSSGTSGINVYTLNGNLVLKAVDGSGRVRASITSQRSIKPDEWNFCAVNFYGLYDEGTGEYTQEYSLTLNDKTQSAYVESTSVIIGLTYPVKYVFGCSDDASSSLSDYGGDVTAICITPYAYKSLTDIREYYRATKDYIIENAFVDETVQTVDFGTSLLYNISSTSESIFDIFPLNNSLLSLSGTRPTAFNMRNLSVLDKDRTYNFNKAIRRYAYVADGGRLEYNFNLGRSGTVLMRIFTDTDARKRYLFESENASGNKIGLYINDGGYLCATMNGSVHTTTLSVSSNIWHTAALSYTPYVSPESGAVANTYSVRIYLDGNIQTFTMTATLTNLAFTVTSIGRMKDTYIVGEHKLESYSECDPLCGQIEMLSVANAFCEESTVRTLVEGFDTVTKTTEYDDLGMLKKMHVGTENCGTAVANVYEYKRNSVAAKNLSGFISKETIITQDDFYNPRTYTTDALGRVTAITDAEFGNKTYTYDYRGYLTNDSGTAITYDSNGNILTRGGISYAYSSVIRDKLIAYNGQVVSYASAGSLYPTAWNGRTYSYEGGRLTSFANSTTGKNAVYTYDNMGLRLSKTSNGFTTNYVYDGNKLITEISSTHRFDFLYDENGRLYGFIYNDREWYFYIRDCLNNILGIVEPDGSLVAKYSYNAFGECTITQDDYDIGKINPFRYKGYYFDTESGMYYCHTRYYVPEWCRWLTPDSLEYLNIESVQGLNLFAYCANDPINMYDPSGCIGILVLSVLVLKTVADKAARALASLVDWAEEFVSDVYSDIEKFDKNNENPQNVFDAKYFSCYKGVFVIKTPFEGSFSYGIIGLSRHSKKIDSLNHEYGHYLQLQKYGLMNYSKYIAAPSFTGFLLHEERKLPGDYFGSYWEAEADKLGGVVRTENNTPWSEEQYKAFWKLYGEIW